MTHMTLKERYEMKQELLVEAFDKQALQKLASIIQQLSKVDFGGLSSFENLRGKINKAATRALKKRDEKSDQLIKKIVETIDVLKDFFGNLDEYVSAIAGTLPKDSVDLSNTKLIELIKNPEKIANSAKSWHQRGASAITPEKAKRGVDWLSKILSKQSFLKMIQTGLKTKSDRNILNVGAAAKEVANLTLAQLKAISESVKQAYTPNDPNSESPSDTDPKTKEPPKQSPSDVKEPEQNTNKQRVKPPRISPEDANTIADLEKAVFDAHGVKNRSELLKQLGMPYLENGYYVGIMAAVQKALK